MISLTLYKIINNKRKLLSNLFIFIFVLMAVTEISNAQNSLAPPLPLLPIPTERQVAWQNTELALFLHFGVNTFTNREWGNGEEDPKIFNPIKLDTRQWAKVAKETGFGKLILTAKHHDGFCLWPSSYTDHSVKNSPWKNGKGDVVAELRQACNEFDLKMGLYLSPWDRHEPTYGDTQRYNLFYLGQLRELLTNYGPLYEVWFDGAKGKDAKDMVYNFDAYWSLVRQLQPQACMFSDKGPDVRWIGNEHGFAGESCWSMMDGSRVSVGKADTKYLNMGDENGPDWIPGECDVSIRKGWFWHPEQEPKSLDQLLEIYFKSVGRNGGLLLNVPPDNRGLFSDADVERLYEFHEALRKIFKKNLTLYKEATTTHFRGNSDTYAASQIVDGNMHTLWSPDDDMTSGILEIDLVKKTIFNLVEIREPVTFGQRIKKYHINIWKNGNWQKIIEGTTIGNRKLDGIEKITTDKIQLRIEESRACPLIAEFGIYLNPYR
jgi:alpha-L-fucosidase